MSSQRLKELLFPKQEDELPVFAAEIERRSLFGLRIVGGIALVLTVFIYALGSLVVSTIPEHTMVAADAAQLVVGASLIAFSFQTRWAFAARTVGVVSGIVSGLIQTFGMSATDAFHQNVLRVTPEQHYPVILALVLPATIALLPVKPMHTLFMGATIVLGFVLALAWLRGVASLLGPASTPIVFSVALVLLFTGLTAILYDQRAEAFLGKLNAEESFELLRNAEASLVVERTAAASSRFAAALSHELNTPLGALTGSFQTLVKLFDGIDERLDENPKLRTVFDDTVQTGASSAKRILEITARMRKLVNLDRAERQRVDLNELCTETVALLSGELAHAVIEIDRSPLPRVECRPHHISGALTNLLRNAAAAIDEGGSIRIRTSQRGREARIEVHDNGRGIEPERLERLFDPEFRVVDGRVATANWGLFVSRSILLDHGGRLELSSQPGAGTTATMTLPTSPSE